MIIGLTGERRVGKSEVVKILLEQGFVRCHPFDGGKAACVGYFMHLGASADDAERMVNGDLKDVPSPILPGNAMPRDLMEPFGAFMGQTMGVEWTLGAELAATFRAHPGRDVVAESLVYEADLFRSLGGLLIRIERPGVKRPAGMMTDAFQRTIQADVTIYNDGTLDDLRRKILDLI